MEKLIIEHNKPKVIKQTIKNDCFKAFDDELTIKEIVDTYGFKENSVKYYRSKYVAEQIYKHTKRSDGYMLGIRKAFSVSEMDYGTTLPTYKWEELEPSERQLTKDKDHKQLSKI